jgi:hypothetical protein
MTQSSTKTIEQLGHQLNAFGLKQPTKFPCGKVMGNHLYVHHSEAEQYLSRSAKSYLSTLLTNKTKAFAVIAKLDTSQLPFKLVSLTEAPKWNTEHEPSLGLVHKLTSSGWSQNNVSQDPLIYHHKWLFVPKSYQGFSVLGAMKRSLAWKTIVGGTNRELSSRIGRKSFWDKWLRTNGLPL